MLHKVKFLPCLTEVEEIMPGNSNKEMNETDYLSSVRPFQDNKNFKNSRRKPKVKRQTSRKRIKRDSTRDECKVELATVNYFLDQEKKKNAELQKKHEITAAAEQTAMREKSVAEESVKKIVVDKKDYIISLEVALESTKRELSNMTNANERNKNLLEQATERNKNLEKELEQFKRERILVMKLIDQIIGKNDTRKTDRINFEDEIRKAIKMAVTFDYVDLDGMKQEITKLNMAKSKCEERRQWEQELAYQLLSQIVITVNKVSGEPTIPEKATRSYENLIEAAMRTVDLEREKLLEIKASKAKCEQRIVLERNLTGKLVSTINNKEKRQPNMTNFEEEIQIAIIKLNAERKNAILVNVAEIEFKKEMIRQMQQTGRLDANKKILELQIATCAELLTQINTVWQEEIENIKLSNVEKDNFLKERNATKNSSENATIPAKNKETDKLINRLNEEIQMLQRNFRENITDFIALLNDEKDKCKREINETKNQCKLAGIRAINETNLVANANKKTLELQIAAYAELHKFLEENNTARLREEIENIKTLHVEKYNCSKEVNETKKSPEDTTILEKNNETDKLINRRLNEEIKILQTNFRENITNFIILLKDEKDKCKREINETKNQCKLARILVINETNRMEDADKKTFELQIATCENENKNKSLTILDLENKLRQAIKASLPDKTNHCEGAIRQAQSETDQLVNELHEELKIVRTNFREKITDLIVLLKDEKEKCKWKINESKKQPRISMRY